MEPILFATESFPSRSPMVSSERVINAFVERQPQGAKSQAPLFGVPGLASFATAGAVTSSVARGAWNFQGQTPYFVIGQSLFTITSAGAVTQVGTGITGMGRVSMADNGMQIIMVNGGGPGGSGWVYDTTTSVFSQITSSAFYPADDVIFMDGYFILNRSGTNEFFLSGLYDGTSYNGLDFASAEARSGIMVGTRQNLQLLFLFTNDHFELWYDAGTLEFPFQRYSGGEAPYGCVASQTIVLQDGAIFLLGIDKIFYRLQANVPIRISSHALETALNKDPDLTQAFCFTHTWEGHKWIVLTLPASSQTWIFDVSTGKWFNRESWGANNFSYGLWRANCVLEAFGKTLVGDAFSNTIGYLSGTVYTEYGNALRVKLVSPTQQHGRTKLFCSVFQIDMQAGVGLTTGQGSNPQWMLRVSRDGGQTYGRIQRWRSMGPIGERLARARWTKLGSGRQLTYELTMADPVECVVIGAFARISLGMD